jgi:hypothetical protein
MTNDTVGPLALTRHHGRCMPVNLIQGNTPVLYVKCPGNGTGITPVKDSHTTHQNKTADFDQQPRPLQYEY